MYLLLTYPTPTQIQHSLQTHLRPIWNSESAFYFDEGQLWNPFRIQKLQNIVSSLSDATVVFVSCLSTFLFAVRAGVKFCITTTQFSKDMPSTYCVFPIHTSLYFYCRRDTVPFFSNPQHSMVFLPSIQNPTEPLLCFNASYIHSNLVVS